MYLEKPSIAFIIPYLLCAGLVLVCHGQSTNYVRNDVSESISDCPKCCVVTSNEISNNLILVKENFRLKRVVMATLEQQIQLELNNTMRDVLDLINKINASKSDGRVLYHGPPGFPGASGATGSIGLSGATGHQGATGYTGPAGDPGSPGATGETGYTGYTGGIGASGATGATGPKGGTGYRGDAGNPGSPGYQGWVGAVGPPGDTGNTGSPGSGRRRRGEDRKSYNHMFELGDNDELRGKRSTADSTESPTVGANNFNHDLHLLGAICSVTCASNFSKVVQGEIELLQNQLEAEAEVVRTLTTTRDELVSLFLQLQQIYNGLTNRVVEDERYRGATGSTGVPGYPGFSGFTGPTGPLGIPGYIGLIGRTGIAGSTGWTGSTGSTGVTGNTGFSGQQGQQGQYGIRGPPGITGVIGNTGATGPKGSPGPYGPPGSIGPVA